MRRSGVARPAPGSMLTAASPALVKRSLISPVVQGRMANWYSECWSGPSETSTCCSRTSSKPSDQRLVEVKVSSPPAWQLHPLGVGGAVSAHRGRCRFSHVAEQQAARSQRLCHGLYHCLPFGVGDQIVEDASTGDDVVLRRRCHRAEVDQPCGARWTAVASDSEQVRRCVGQGDDVAAGSESGCVAPGTAAGVEELHQERRLSHSRRDSLHPRLHRVGNEQVVNVGVPAVERA